MSVLDEARARVSTLVNSHQLLLSFGEGFTYAQQNRESSTLFFEQSKSKLGKLFKKCPQFTIDKQFSTLLH